MHLKTIQIRNFRCFEKLDLELHPRLTVLVAENGGGKSAVLDAIAVGLSPLLRYLSSANQRLSGPGIKDTDFRLEPWEDRGGIEKWGAADFAQIILQTTEGLRWDQWRGSSSGQQPTEKVGQTELANLISLTLASLKTGERKPLPVFAHYGATRGWIEIPERLRGSKVDYGHPTAALAESLTAISDFKEMLNWFDSQESAELRSNRGMSPEDWTPSSALEEVRESINKILGKEYVNPHFNERHKFVVERKDGGILQVAQLSQGYQSMLAMAMDFARRLAIANDHFAHMENTDEWASASDYYRNWGPEMEEGEELPLYGARWARAIMLVDEIDLHLHPSWQQRVLNDLMRAFPQTQFIVTTHSPQVVSTVRPENIRIIQKLPDGAWITRKPDRNPYAHANSLSLEAVMGGDAYPALPLTEVLREYQRLVGADQHDSARALELRASLEKEWGKPDSELQIMDIAIRKNETLRKLRQEKA